MSAVDDLRAAVDRHLDFGDVTGRTAFATAIAAVEHELAARPEPATGSAAQAHAHVDVARRHLRDGDPLPSWTADQWLTGITAKLGDAAMTWGANTVGLSPSANLDQPRYDRNVLLVEVLPRLAATAAVITDFIEAIEAEQVVVRAKGG